ncbi:MAG TPA: PQQ-dependent sugar dehydrogenase [Egibacteraceae bacterium]|nr:PQQ-dependent sugar dehydrogenase [Egibacteraceae bacterium]
MPARMLAVFTALLTALVLGGAREPALAATDVERVGGADRIATAVALSQAAHPGGAPAAVVALAWRFPDALAAAPLASAVGGPVLLTGGERLDAAVRAELSRLGVGTVYLVGGPQALSADVEADVDAIDGVDVERLAGADRFSTAAAIALRAVELWRAQGHADAGQQVLIALGAHADPGRAWPDTLAAGPLAGHARWPILLTDPTEVPAATQEALAELEASQAVIVGGEAAIPPTTAAQIGDGDVATRRIGGLTRHHTSVLLAEEAIAHGAQRSIALLATADAFPDGLAAGPAAHAQGGVLLLTAPAALPDAPHVIAWLADWRGEIDVLQIIGGPAAVSAEVSEQAQSLFSPLRLRAVEAARGLASPVFLASPPGEQRLVVIEQAGRIRMVHPDGSLSTFLDITGRVGSGGERGLLGLAFHPEYAANRRLYLHYNRTNGDTRVSEFRASADGTSADPGSERAIFSVAQPFSNHNGGMLAFGPDGRLYLALGDGGGGGDPQDHGQDPSTPLGALLRMNPDGSAPADNPFAAGGGHPLVFSYGLRNPWRFSFDRISSRIYIGDVGQSQREEVNVADADDSPVNYGWNEWEGTHCFSGPCGEEGKVFPAVEYPTGSEGCAVTGGYVYRGRDIPALTGQYLYSDYCGGWFRSFRVREGDVVEEADWSADLGSLGNISSFGVDSRGELYIVSRSQGRVYRIEQR